MAKTIGIIGSGMIGSQTARLAVAAGFNVVISNSRGPESLADLIAELGNTARAAHTEENIKVSDIVVAAIPFGAYKKLSPELLAGKIVIDTMNYYPERDGVMDEVRTDIIASSEIVQNQLPKSHVVKGLNNMDFIRLLSCARPGGSPERSALPIAGDFGDAKATVTEFIDAIGYDVVDMGSLKDSWRSEPMTPVYVFPYIAPSKRHLLPEEADAYFATAPGAVVSSRRVQELITEAKRHDNLVGSMSAFREKMLAG